ncbi:hypothetical protein LXA43DRAFT_998166, partial [Ganoderma leucocontextum]
MASVLEDNENEGLKEEVLPNIPHDTVEGTIFQHGELLPFWNAYRSWLSAHGVVLYELRRVVDWILIEHWCAPPVTASTPLPFATRLNPGSAEILGRPVQSKYGLGQDLSGNDLFIKLTDTHSTEHQINQYLLNHSKADTKPKWPSFPYALCPTAVLDSPHNFSFIVMPCWGARVEIEDFDCMRVILTFIRCLLTGLSFLHEHRIAHRDIRETNVLMNGYCPDLEEWQCKGIVNDHLQSPDLAFAMFDYDLSIKLPPGVSLKYCRLPSSEGDRGGFHFHPRDISLGEPEYNPFAFDVGCMGNMFLYYFVEAIRVLPQLAPLFARMTTHVVDGRFTASEALAFFQDHFGDLPDDVLATRLVLSPSFEPLVDPEVYWSLLNAEDSERWKGFSCPEEVLVPNTPAMGRRNC